MIMLRPAVSIFALVVVSACSLMPRSTIGTVPPPADFSRGAECQAHATVEPSLSRPPTIPDQQGGWVAVTFDLFSQGRPSNVQVVDSSPKGLFDKVAIEGLSHAAFVPDTERRVGCRYLMVFPGK
jgi:TonB family protein